MEYKIGGEFIDGSGCKLKVVEAYGCTCKTGFGYKQQKCRYIDLDCSTDNEHGTFNNPPCSAEEREDMTNVVFIEV